MQRPSRRTRWTALALLAACVGAVSQPAPSVLPGHDGGPRLVLQSGPPAAAVPVSTWAGVVEGGDSSSPAPTNQTTRPGAGASWPSEALLQGPTEPDLPVLRSGAGLLGLSAVPANAPPHA